MEKEIIKPVKDIFGKLPDGATADLFTISNNVGLTVKITNYGATVVSIITPDKNGNIEDIVLGYDNVEGYVNDQSYFGCTVGRYGNRIAKGKFQLEGKEYNLAINNGPNHLHGGVRGFNKVLWDVIEVKGNSIKLNYLSKDGEEGYPGNLNITVTFLVSNDNELRIDYLATTDQKTFVNLTNHSYFNLAGQGRGDILHHKLTLNAANFTPVDDTLIPTGEIRSVKGTPMDFTMPKLIGERIVEKYDQLTFGNGYDHNWVVNKESEGISMIATVEEMTSGRVMEVYTTEPGVQFYSGNFLNGVDGKDGKNYKFRNGFCLETQHFPDSPNKPNFPSTVLKPGEQYNSTTIYKFTTI